MPYPYSDPTPTPILPGEIVSPHPKATASATRFAGVSRRASIAVLTATLAGIAWCLWVTSTQHTGPLRRPADEKKGEGDLILFRRVVERVHSGESYYDAWGDEVRSRGYPARSVFNWRLPLFFWLNGSLPGLIWGQLLLSILALVTVLLVYGIVRSETGIPTAMAAVFLVGFAVASCLKPNVFMSTELWAGTLIAFSVCAYAYNWKSAGVAGGLLALFLRELSLPYCLVCVALSCWRKRRLEVLAWFSGLVVFVIYFGVHALMVARHQQPGDLAHTEGYVRSRWHGIRPLDSRVSYPPDGTSQLDLGVLLAAGGSGSCGLAGREWDASELDCGNLPRRIRIRRPALQ